MAAHYDLIKDFTQDEYGDVVTVSPYWALAVIRLANQATFDRIQMRGISDKPEDAIKVRDKTLIISSDCIFMSTQGDKGQPLKNLQATLLQGKVNYLTEIMPGDWVLAWMVYGEEKIKDIIDRIRTGKACNKFDDGLKFVGKVQSIRKSLSVDRSSGTKIARYALQGTAFRELNSTVFYDPYLAFHDGTFHQWLNRIGVELNDLIRVPTDVPGSSKNSGIDINRAIPTFLEVLLGKGIKEESTNPAGQQAVRIATGGQMLPAMVPKEVGDLLGKTSQREGIQGALAYTDMTELLFGIQRYRSQDIGNIHNQFRSFAVDGVGNFQRNGTLGDFRPEVSANPRQFKWTGVPMSGSFLPIQPNFSDKSVWSILNQWLNPVINEMYTALRVNEVGDIIPTIIARQIPFTTPALANVVENNLPGLWNDTDIKLKIDNITPFLELPRWKFHNTLVWQEDLGRSDALRFNFIRILGTAVAHQDSVNQTKQLVRNPPLRDDLDIRRNGLRAYNATVDCSLREQVDGPKAWTALASDYLIGQHLTLTGTINSIGIQSPIAEGDNLEYDNVVYHIETITHACQIGPGGAKSWSTSLNLTHGMRSDTDPQATNGTKFLPLENLASNEKIDFSDMYSGMPGHPEDNRTLDPGFVSEDSILGDDKDGE